MKKLDELNLPKHQEKPTEKPRGKLPVPVPTLPPKIKFWLNSFIPNTLSGVRPAPGGPFAGRQVFPGPPHPFHWNSCFETDDRSFSSAPGASSRVGIEAEIDTVSEDITFTPKAGLTFEVECNTGVVKCKSMPSPSVTAFKIPNPLKALGHSNNLNYLISGSGNDPCVTGSPNLAFRGVVSIDPKARTLSFKGTTTIFPAFEMYASSGSSTVTIFTRSPSGNSPLLLLIPGISPVSGVASI